MNDVVSHLVYACSGLEIDTVFCEGKLLLKDGKHTLMPRQKIMKDTEKYRNKIMAAVTVMRAEPDQQV